MSDQENLPQVQSSIVPPGIAQLELIEVKRGAFGVDGSGDTSGFGGLVDMRVMPQGTEPPYGGTFDEIAAELALALADHGVAFASAVEKVVVDRDELTFFVPRQHLLLVAQLLRDEPGLRFELSLGVTGVHYLNDAERELHSVIHLMSVTHNRRLRLETTAPDADPHIPSTVGIYPANDWHEREAFDMFGIVYDGHPALTRILMPDDWVGHPQRKDYPLGGIPVEYKGATIPPPDQRRAYN